MEQEQEEAQAFTEAEQLFRDVDAELDSILALSPGIFDVSTQLGVRSAGLPTSSRVSSPPVSPVELEEVDNQGEDRYTPHTPSCYMLTTA